MDEPITIYEGTWEEVRAHDAELTGRYVRLIARALDQHAVPNRRELWTGFKDRMKQKSATALSPDSVVSTPRWPDRLVQLHRLCE